VAVVRDFTFNCMLAVMPGAEEMSTSTVETLISFCKLTITFFLLSAIEQRCVKKSSSGNGSIWI
jgi:hypothetical protein